MHSVWRFKPGWAFWIVYFSVDWFKSTSSMHIKAVREGKWTLIHMKQCLFWWFETKGKKKKAVFLVRLFAWLLEFLFDGLNLFLFLTRTTVYFQYLDSACSYAHTVRFLLLLTCFDKRWWLIFVVLYLDASAWQENLALTMIFLNRSLLPLTAKGCREKHRTIHDLTRASGRNNWLLQLPNLTSEPTVQSSSVVPFWISQTVSYKIDLLLSQQPKCQLKLNGF